MPEDPFASIATPTQASDPFAAIAQPVSDSGKSQLKKPSGFDATQPGSPAHAASELAEMLAGATKAAAKISGPNVVYEALRKGFPQLGLKPLLGMPTTNEAMATAVPMVLGGMEGGETESGAANIPKPAQPAVASPGPGAASMLEHPAVTPWIDAMKAELSKIPGANLLKTVAKSARGLAEGTPEAPAAPAPIPQTNGVPWGQRIPPQGPPELWGKEIPAEVPAVPPTPEGAVPTVQHIPQPPSMRYLSGDSALRQILTGQDNANLLKIAKSRGLNVTREAALKPGVSDQLLVNKILNDFSNEELQDIADTFDTARRNRHQFGDIGAEAQKTLSLQTYFPDVKIPDAVLKRTQAAISRSGSASASPSEEGDLTEILQKSLVAATKKTQ